MNKQEAVGNAGKKEHIKWIERMDSVFIDAMVKQEIGNRVNSQFTSLAYTYMIKELNEKLEMQFTKNHLKNRLKSLKVSFSQWYDMFRGISFSGFSWNSETHLIEAEAEVWENLINSKPEATFLKTKKIANYDQMMMLFAKDRASGANAETAKEKNARLARDIDIKIETIEEVDELLATNDIILESQHKVNDDDIQVLSPTHFSADQNSSGKKFKAKKRKVQDLEEEKEEETFESKIMNAVADVASAMREGNLILERAYHRELTCEEICKELEPMGLESHEIPRALMYLLQNQAYARALFGCPLNMRMGLLMQMMSAHK